MRHDLISDALCIIKNAEFIGKKECKVPVSKLIKGMLTIIKTNEYIKDFKLTHEEKGDYFHVHLAGKINDCNSIRPQYSFQVKDVVKWEKRFLPAREIGILIITTSKGIMDQRQAEKEKSGGRLLGYVY
ncbi:MAG: 30S ribosomal protein S8 [Candidatus Aenigmatarchaeota archaeon]